MKNKLFLVLILFSNFVFSEVTPKVDSKEESKKEVVMKTGAINQLSKLKKIRRVKEFTRASSKRDAVKTAKQIILEDIEKSGTFLAALKIGTRITNIDTDEVYIVPKDVIFKLYNESDSEGFQYIISRDEEVYHKVKSSDVSDLKAVTKMHRDPETFTRVPKSKTLKVFDDQFKMFFQGALHRETVGGSFPRKATDTTVQPGVSLRYQLAGFFEWYMPAELGFSVEWENVTYQNNIFYNITNKSMNLGINVRSKKIYLFGDHPLRIGGAFLWSPISKLTANSASLGNISADVSQNSLEFFTQMDFENFIGEYFIGAKVRSRWQKFSEKEKNFDDANTVNDVSVGFYIGQGFSQIW